MAFHKKKKPDEFTPDENLCTLITARLPQGEMTCATAFALADELGISTSDLGYYADHLRIRLVKCQIGLFGYGKGKKLISALDTVDDTLKTAIQSKTNQGVIHCEQVFDVAKTLVVSKVTIGNACETMGIKIKHCRFGAF